MYHLSVIKSLNAVRPTKIESNFNRNSSSAESRGGIVLHSASRRSTCFISDPTRVVEFRRLKAACASQSEINTLIESYF